ncbi:hypothetical protein OIO90_005877 [Microbotryomycetes sp. JL221]|nr:hypothetical protein OIO90_005877 [Microbotryomycetes sp. JL221]
MKPWLWEMAKHYDKHFRLQGGQSITLQPPKLLRILKCRKRRQHCDKSQLVWLKCLDGECIVDVGMSLDRVNDFEQERSRGIEEYKGHVIQINEMSFDSHYPPRPKSRMPRSQPYSPERKIVVVVTKFNLVESNQHVSAIKGKKWKSFWRHAPKDVQSYLNRLDARTNFSKGGVFTTASQWNRATGEGDDQDQADSSSSEEVEMDDDEDDRAMTGIAPAQSNVVTPVTLNAPTSKPLSRNRPNSDALPIPHETIVLNQVTTGLVQPISLEAPKHRSEIRRSATTSTATSGKPETLTTLAIEQAPTSAAALRRRRVTPPAQDEKATVSIPAQQTDKTDDGVQDKSKVRQLIVEHAPTSAASLRRHRRPESTTAQDITEGNESEAQTLPDIHRPTSIEGVIAAPGQLITEQAPTSAASFRRRRGSKETPDSNGSGEPRQQSNDQSNALVGSTSEPLQTNPTQTKVVTEQPPISAAAFRRRRRSSTEKRNEFIPGTTGPTTSGQANEIVNTTRGDQLPSASAYAHEIVTEQTPTSAAAFRRHRSAVPSIDSLDDLKTQILMNDKTLTTSSSNASPSRSDNALDKTESRSERSAYGRQRQVDGTPRPNPTPVLGRIRTSTSRVPRASLTAKRKSLQSPLTNERLERDERSSSVIPTASIEQDEDIVMSVDQPTAAQRRRQQQQTPGLTSPVPVDGAMVDDFTMPSLRSSSVAMTSDDEEVRDVARQDRIMSDPMPQGAQSKTVSSSSPFVPLTALRNATANPKSQAQPDVAQDIGDNSNNTPAASAFTKLHSQRDSTQPQEPKRRRILLDAEEDVFTVTESTLQTQVTIATQETQQTAEAVKAHPDAQQQRQQSFGHAERVKKRLCFTDWLDAVGAKQVLQFANSFKFQPSS